MALGCSDSGCSAMLLKTSPGAENTEFVLHSSCTRLIDLEAACRASPPAVLAAAVRIDQIAHWER